MSADVSSLSCQKFRSPKNPWSGFFCQSRTSTAAATLQQLTHARVKDELAALMQKHLLLLLRRSVFEGERITVYTLRPEEELLLLLSLRKILELLLTLPRKKEALPSLAARLLLLGLRKIMHVRYH